MADMGCLPLFFCVMKNSFFLAILLSAAILSSCKEVDGIKSKINGRSDEKPVSVTVIKIELNDAVERSSYVGKVESSKTVSVFSQYSGVISSIKVREGQSVQAGQVLAEISSETVKSAYVMAKATLEQAQDGYSRMMSVYEKGGVTQVKKKEVETQLRKAEAAEAAAADALNNCSIKAPYSGVIDDIFVEEGEDVSALAPVLRVVNVNSLEIHFPVPEGEVSKVHPGQDAVIEIPAIGKEIEGKVIAKGATASAISHAYDCVAAPSAGFDGVLPGMSCKVRIITPDVASIVVPVTAVNTDMNGRYVWYVKDNKVSKKYIEIGGYCGDGVSVTKGLAFHDLVIVEGARKVSTGMRVNVIER